MNESKTKILESALDVLRAGRTLSLESVAQEAGITKPGLMYHFPTKEALMLGLVDYVVNRSEKLIAEHLAIPLAAASPRERIWAYVEYTLSTHFDETDIVMMSDPRLRDTLSDRWTTQMAPWITLPEDMPLAERSRLTAVRLLADGAWFASATKVFAPTDAELEQIRKLAEQIAKGSP